MMTKCKPTLKFGRRIHLKLRADALRPHPHAQRSIGKAILAAKEEFCPELVVVSVVQIDGQYYIVDGQHRWYKLMYEYDLPEWEVDVHFYPDVTTDRDAHLLFLALNKQSLPNAMAMYTNREGAGDPTAVGIKTILADVGLAVKNVPGPHAVAAASALTKAYELDGGKSLRAAVGVITKTWPGEAKANEGVMVRGLALFLHANKVSPDVLTKVLRRRAPEALIHEARTRLGGSLAERLSGRIREIVDARKIA
jgi:hypothetical protein